VTSIETGVATAGFVGGRTGDVTGVTGEASERSNDVASFERWYRAEYPRLLAIVTVACGDRHLAEETTAEAFARALAAWRRVGVMDEPSAWTYRVAVNLLRRRARRAATEARVLDALPTAAVARNDLDAVELWDAVGALPPRERLAVALRYAGGCSEAEVARAMRVSVGTASSMLSSARRRLAVALQEETEPVHD
jgi:RNA polymerase sigma-70 factor (ECF subfamily)